jgi:hypothetical protein
MIKGWVDSASAQSLKLKIDEIPKKTLRNLRPAVQELAKQVRSQGRAMAPVRTGLLTRKITYTTKVYDDAVIARVWSKAPHAHLMEYGMFADEFIRSHSRNLTVVFGRPLASPITVIIRAHARKVQVPGYHYMHGALEAMTGTIKDGLTHVLVKTVMEADI